ncbi:MAG TPA: hypothetical protein VKA67_10070, partial [Verrucomicrobiae bacterium]|nr:hypothetical protein [Verrucomicrobiae bacterium]
MPIGGIGQNSLGFAKGSIIIDTSGAQGAAMTMRRVGQDIRGSLDNAGRGAMSFSEGIRAIRSELVAVGAAGAILTKIGLDGAKSIRNYRVSFTQLLGDERQATELMRQLTDQANMFGLEVEETWQLARALLPSLEGNTEELGKFVTQAALLASTNPLKSTVDASRAIQEYLSGQTISLQRLFNVDPNIIAEAQAQFEGVGDQLDYILNRLGATEEGALQMADAFVGTKNELKLLLSEGFTPL